MTVKVTCLQNPGHCQKGRLANLSAHGLSLILSDGLPTGAAAKVEWGSANFVGEIIYCQPYLQEFLLGLRVDDPVYDATKSSQNETSAT
jgi:hypothetical protein